MTAAIRVDETLLARLDAEARRRGLPLEEFVERALREHLDSCEPARAESARELPPLPTARLGQPRVNVADREAVYRFLEEHEGE